MSNVPPLGAASELFQPPADGKAPAVQKNRLQDQLVEEVTRLPVVLQQLIVAYEPRDNSPLAKWCRDNGRDESLAWELNAAVKAQDHSIDLSGLSPWTLEELGSDQGLRLEFRYGLSSSLSWKLRLPCLFENWDQLLPITSSLTIDVLGAGDRVDVRNWFCLKDLTVGRVTADSVRILKGVHGAKLRVLGGDPAALQEAEVRLFDPDGELWGEYSADTFLVQTGGKDDKRGPAA